MRLTLVIAALSLIGAQAQPLPVPAACARSGQTAERAFDPKLVAYVDPPKPLAGLSEMFGNVELEVIARVAGIRPLILEILDGRYYQQGITDAFRACSMIRIYSVETGLRSILPSLRHDDLVKARLTAGSGVLVDPILSGIEKYSGPYFHDTNAAPECSNRSGELASAYYQDSEGLTIFRDASVVYRDRNGNRLSNTRLRPEELARLLEAFGTADFEHFGGTLHPIDTRMPTRSITLDCSRYQRLLLDERESLMAPVIQAFDAVRKIVLTNGRYRLRYREKHEVEVLDWPFAQFPLDRWEAAKSESGGAMHQDVPAAFLAKLPAMSSPDQNVYVRQGTKIFQVNRTCTKESPECRTFESLHVYEIRDAGALIAALAPSTVLSGYGGILWPSNMGFTLGSLAPEGKSLDLEEYMAHEPLCQQLLASQSGLMFIEGRYIYKGVRMTLEER